MSAVQGKEAFDGQSDELTEIKELTVYLPKQINQLRKYYFASRNFFNFLIS